LHAQQPVECVTVNTDGKGNGGAGKGMVNPMSADGRYVAFASSSDALVDGDVNGFEDVFVRDRQTGVIVLMSISSSGTQGNGQSSEPAISGDGRFVAFASYADNLIAHDTNSYSDVFLHDRDPDGDGLFDENNAITILVSKPYTGVSATANSYRPSLSGDGTTIVFESGAKLTPDSDGSNEIYAFDVASRTLTCVSLAWNGNPGGGDSTNASVSRDGNLVAFESMSSQMVQSDQNGDKDVFVRDRAQGITQIVSIGNDGHQANDDSQDAAISSDGTTVAFVCSATNLLAPLNGTWRNVYVRDLVLQTTSCVTVLPDGTEPGNDSFRPALSEDGKLVVFHSYSSTLVPMDKNTASDVLLYDRTAATFETVSANCVGFTANGSSDFASITPDRRWVSFQSDATNLVDGKFQGDLIYLRDRTISWPMASHANYGAGWPGTLGIPDLTADVDPQYGATVTVDFGNSWGPWTVGFLLVGLSQESLPTSKDGTLLVDLLRAVPLAVGPTGVDVETRIPFDASLCGAEIDVQGIEMDPGATKGMSFTAGLQLIVGR
jgi:Tol biopolymer transport system component